MRNKERHSSVGVDSRLAEAALSPSTVPPLGVCVMATARANWKGYLRLSLVSCPIALYPATSESEKVRFNQLNKNTGNRIRYSKVDAETGDEVDSEDIIKGTKSQRASTSKSPTRTLRRSLWLTP